MYKETCHILNFARSLQILFYLHRIGIPEDSAKLVAFLSSDYASYITGENIVISGGHPTRL